MQTNPMIEATKGSWLKVIVNELGHGLAKAWLQGETESRTNARTKGPNRRRNTGSANR